MDSSQVFSGEESSMNAFRGEKNVVERREVSNMKDYGLSARQNAGATSASRTPNPTFEGND
jgi:hypothetical protein